MTYPYFGTRASNFREGLRPPAWKLDIRSETALQLEQGSIQVGVAREVAPLLMQLGANPDAVIRAAGLDLAMLTDPNAIISLGAFCDLIIRSGACTGCPHFGLLLGQRVSLSSLGLIGSIMLRSETFGDALRSLIRHVEMHCIGATTALTAKVGTAVWNCVVESPALIALTRSPMPPPRRAPTCCEPCAAQIGAPQRCSYRGRCQLTS
ncbi:AraC family transcriptional regulator ligand-binding domain-containing protein [Methylorubrum extorquens]|uniref:AraC family transcriptional regulator ligand-binding domain-containing protein n=1 Tax=Methylorubrum extorquens TaxID=408 RepID=UPI001EE59965|nr:AraC family transcriptional regulator ligand-binding domain-containing protein [Methylorubrum extorquens]MCG5249485.1 AraC family transcriptional regulator [Methylorubrum extorquens]